MNLVYIQPAPALRRDFARWATAQTPKVRTASSLDFAVPADLFAGMPEALLLGALVDGRRYVSPDEDGEPVGTVMVGEDGPEAVIPLSRTGDLLGVATAEGLDGAVPAWQTAVPGEALPDVPESAYGPDTVPLDYAPLDDTPPDDSDSSDPEPDMPDGTFSCPDCDRAFGTERGRDTHRRMAHPEEH